MSAVLKNFSLGALLSRLALLMIVVAWTIPTLGLFVSSLRDRDLLSTTGWWTAFQTNLRFEQARTNAADVQTESDGVYTITGNALEVTNDDGEVTLNPTKSIRSFGGGFLPASGTETYAGNEQPGIRDYAPGTTVTLENGETFTLNADGTYTYTSPVPFDMERGRRFFVVTNNPPSFSLRNYQDVLSAEGVADSFINTFTVTIPATIIPIAVAAFAAYAFSWMEFPGRRWMFYVVVALIVVPLQMSLIPLLRIYNEIGIAKTYPGIWLAHTGFGLPMAIYLLRNYIGGLPREIIESAKIDGASHFQIFMRLVLPLSVPALASFAIFQFLWVWNDLLVALVFLGKDAEQIVLTSKLRELLGSRAENWEILTASAFVSIIVPLVVFFSLQRYFVRGLLAGSVKGG
ncbi:MAG: ABC transporter permease subunit [Anaerolineae bacterium]|jgi:alpha-glucoside transport system permease protein|nr:ABC transporter permease subunit [Anaerolineae bacterium]